MVSCERQEDSCLLQVLSGAVASGSEVPEGSVSHEPHLVRGPLQNGESKQVNMLRRRLPEQKITGPPGQAPGCPLSCQEQFDFRRKRGASEAMGKHKSERNNPIGTIPLRCLDHRLQVKGYFCPH